MAETGPRVGDVGTAMAASTGLRALVLASLAILLVACTDPSAGAATTPMASSDMPEASEAGGSAAPGASAAPSTAPEGPDDYGY